METDSTIVSRQTSKGLLLVAVVDGKVAATLASKTIGGSFARLPKAQPSPEGPIVAVVGSTVQCALYAAEATAIEAALAAAHAARLATPEGQRAELVARLCDTDAFPGSRAWLKAQAARDALAAFDAAHPEVLAAIQAEHEASMATNGVGRGGGL